MEGDEEEAEEDEAVVAVVFVESVGGFGKYENKC